MKTLASCTPTEFLIQTNRIRKSVEKWLKATDIMNIRKNVPQLNIPEGATQEEVNRIMAEHKEKLSAQVKINFSKILDAILADHPQETLELLSLICFIEPEDMDNHKISEYLIGITEILNDDAVLGFFTSLMRLEQTNTSNASRV